MDSQRQELETPTLDPRLRHALDHHLTDPRAANHRLALEHLAGRMGQPVSSQELQAVMAGAQATLVYQVMVRLMELTDAFGNDLGFQINKIPGPSCSKGNSYVLVLKDAPFVPRQRVLPMVSTLPNEIPITDKMERLASRMSGEVSFSRVPPDERRVISLVHNARLLRAETPDIAYVMALVASARKRMALHIHGLRALGIPQDSARYNRNLLPCSQSAAVELGFVLAAVQAKYQAIFFLDPDKREEAIFKQTGNPEHPCLDQVIPFDEVTLKRRLSKVKEQELGDRERAAIRLISGRQSEGRPIRFKEFKEQGFSEKFCDKLRKNTSLNRDEWGFYVRFRGDDSLQCILLEMV